MNEELRKLFEDINGASQKYKRPSALKPFFDLCVRSLAQKHKDKEIHLNLFDRGLLKYLASYIGSEIKID